MLSMFEAGLLMLTVTAELHYSCLVNTVHSKGTCTCSKFVVGVKISAAVDSKHNDSPSYSS